MPLDPTLANPSVVQLPNPMEAMGNALKNAYLVNEIRKSGQEQAVTNALIQAGKVPGVIGPDGMMNNALFMQNAAQLGAGPQLGKLQLDLSNVAKNKAETYKFSNQGDEANQNAIKALIENAHNSLGGVDMNDPQNGLKQYATRSLLFHHNLAGLMPNSEVPGQSLQEDLSEAQNAANGGLGSWQQFMVSRQKGLAEAHENIIKPFNAGGTVGLTSTNKYGPPQGQTVPGSEHAVTLNPNSPNANPLGNALSADAAKELQSLHTAAMAAPQAVRNIDQIANLFKSGKVISGAGGKLQLDVARTLDALGIHINPDSATATQEAQKGLSSLIFNQITQLKNSGLPMSRFTNMDLALAQQANPNTTLTPEANLDLLSKIRRTYQDAVGMHNTRVPQILSTLPPNAPQRSLYPQLPSIPEQGPNVARGTSGRGISSDSILQLLNNPQLAPMFDKSFGPGSADHILHGNANPAGGGTPTGGIPFPAVGAPQ